MDCRPRFSIHSKYNGYPYLQSPTDWPLCTMCGNLMPLVFQLNLSEIPSIRPENALIQYFECVTRDLAGSTCELGYPKNNSSLVRKVKITVPPIQVPVDFSSLFSVEDSFSKLMLKKISLEHKIVGWQPFDDYPSLVDVNAKMEYLTAYIGEDALDFLWENLEVLEKIENKHCSSEDKLFGYPHWSQTECYPKKMSEEIELLYQINGFVTSARSSIAFRDGERGMFFQTDDLKDIVFTTG
ncbi:DUF1963 domain-containing protein [Flagellimonas iocasae]|uniref:DUF1963 domain-containing protein n=1 Tax=Flagellimonas iocasae TaxID=2055905 RepID=A0ABW4XWL9_9FLAO